MALIIKITMRDGTIKKFPHKERPGGSYTNNIKYETGFVVIRDSWGDEVAVPSQDIEQIETWTT